MMRDRGVWLLNQEHIGSLGWPLSSATRFLFTFLHLFQAGLEEGEVVEGKGDGRGRVVMAVVTTVTREARQGTIIPSKKLKLDNTHPLSMDMKTVISHFACFIYKKLSCIIT